MKKRKMWLIRLIFSFAVLASAMTSFSQTTPEELNRIPMKEQVQYIENHTKVYDGWRAIREDIYRKVTGNFTDSLSSERKRINELQNIVAIQNQKIDSLGKVLGTTINELDDVSHSKNTIRFFGIGINKIVYNTIMLGVIAGLIFILGTGFFAFKRNLSLYLSLKKELAAQAKEFEDYRQTARKAREKMSMDHFNEIKKLKGNKA